MKTVKLSILALSALAGGSLGAFAAPAPNTGTESPFHAVWTNPVPNSVFVLDNAPLPDTNSTTVVTTLDESVSTDGSGKIDGAAVYRVTFINSSNTVAIADLVCSVSGNIVTTGGSTPGPQATVNIKGNGSSVDSSGNIGVASINATFKGTPTNLTTTGSTLWKGTFVSGTLKTGLAVVNTGKPISLAKAPASAGGLGESLFFDGLLVQSNTKLYAMGDTVFGAGLDGSGSVNTRQATYTFNSSGFGFSKGASLKLSGGVTKQTNVWFTFGTNTIKALVTIPATATANGKLAGQTLKNVPGGNVFFP